MDQSTASTAGGAASGASAGAQPSAPAIATTATPPTSSLFQGMGSQVLRGLATQGAGTIAGAAMKALMPQQQATTMPQGNPMNAPLPTIPQQLQFQPRRY